MDERSYLFLALVIVSVYIALGYHTHIDYSQKVEHYGNF